MLEREAFRSNAPSVQDPGNIANQSTQKTAATEDCNCNYCLIDSTVIGNWLIPFISQKMLNRYGQRQDVSPQSVSNATTNTDYTQWQG